MTHSLKVMTRKGHEVITYNPRSKSDISEMREKFDEIIREGYFVYGGPAGSSTKDQVRTFDPQVEEMIATLPMAGG